MHVHLYKVKVFFSKLSQLICDDEKTNILHVMAHSPMITMKLSPFCDDFDPETPINNPLDYEPYLTEILASQCTPVPEAPTDSPPMAPLALPTSMDVVVPEPPRTRQPSRKEKENFPPKAGIRKLSKMTGPVSQTQLQAVFKEATQRATNLATAQKLAFREELKKDMVNQKGKRSEIASRREAKVSREFKIRYRENIERELFRVLHENLLAWNILERKPKPENHLEDIMAELEMSEQGHPQQRARTL